MTFRPARSVWLRRGVFFCAGCGVSVLGQVSLDGTIGRSGPLTGPNYQISSDLGRQAGPNLFHSFKEFSLSSGESAAFFGPAEIQNVLARVTGGTLSSIDGAIRSTIPGANLYFVNPAGVLFGPNASLDVSGSFAVSTADYLKLGNGGRFDAARPEASVLTSAPVEAFGFLGPSAGPIQMDGARLSVNEGRAFSIIGGDVEMKGGEVRAPGGIVSVASVKSAGELAVSVAEIEFGAGRLQWGRFDLSGGAKIDVGGGGQTVVPGAIPLTRGNGIGVPFDGPTGSGGGQIVIRAGRLVMDNSALYQTTEGQGQGGSIDVRLEEDLSARNGSQIVATALGPLKGGSVNVEADRLTLADGSFVETSTADGGGRAGNSTIRARKIEVLNGSQIGSDSFASGDTGDLELKTSDVLVNSLGSPLSTSINTTSWPGGGKAGNVRVEVMGTLEILNQPGGGLSGLGSRGLGRKSSGDVEVEANRISIDGHGATGSFLNQARTEQTGIISVSASANPEAGEPGTVKIVTGTLDMNGYSIVSGATFGIGKAGNVDVTADRIHLDNSSIVSSTGEGSFGDGGSVQVKSRQMEIRAGGGIGARTAGRGDAGTVEVIAEDILLDFGSIYADVQRGSTGKGGEVKVLGVESLKLVNAGNIEASTLGPEMAGNVTVEASHILIDGSDQREPFHTFRFEETTFPNTGIGSQSLNTETGGPGGNVTVTAETLQIRGLMGTISAETKNTGDGGSIQVNVRELQLDQGGNINSSSIGTGKSGIIQIEARKPIVLRSGSSITTAARVSDARGITVTSPLIELHDSQITSQAALDGGQLQLDAPLGIRLFRSRVTSEAGQDGGNILVGGSLVTLNRSEFNANAILGHGGAIQVTTDSLLKSADSLITADSQQGVNGVIRVLGPAVDLSGSLLSLPSALLGADATLPEHCGINLGQYLSSFRVLGRRGLPLRPGGWQPSFVPAHNPEQPAREQKGNEGEPK